MKLEDLKGIVVCNVNIIKPFSFNEKFFEINFEDLYRGCLDDLPEELLSKEIFCMYSTKFDADTIRICIKN